MTTRKQELLERRTADIMILRQEFKVRKFTDYQYRIDGFIDLYPTNRAYHNIKTQERGIYPQGDIEPFVYKQKEKI
jgi:hypothetical protein